MSKEWLKQPAFIQSFAPTSLLYISNQTDLPKILLIDDVNMPTQDTNQVSCFLFNFRSCQFYIKLFLKYVIHIEVIILSPLIGSLCGTWKQFHRVFACLI